jgi:hypothetical protein
MDIVATCEHCEREVPLGDVVNAPGITGRCPWCGESLAPDNIGLLVDTVRRAEAAGFELVRALCILSGDWTRFQIQPRTVLSPITEHLPTATDVH